MKAGDYTYDADAGGSWSARHRFGPDEYVRKLDADEPEATAALSGGAGLVRLDLTVTPELEAEGLARDLAREVNEARRKEGLDVSDRIRLVVDPGRHDELRGRRRGPPSACSPRRPWPSSWCFGARRTGHPPTATGSRWAAGSPPTSPSTASTAERPPSAGRAGRSAQAAGDVVQDRLAAGAALLAGADLQELGRR